MARGAGALALLALLAVHPAVAAAPASILPSGAALAPLAPDGPVVEHTADTLWEKIDGEAEQYRRFGVRTMAAAYFTLPGDPMRGVEISVFDMGGPLGAFGIFAAYRSPSAPRAALGNDGAVADRQVMLWHGSRFVLIDGFGPDATRGEDLRRATEAVVLRLGPAPRRPDALAAFERIVRPETVLFLPDHLLGREALPAGFEGMTADGVRAFVSLPGPAAPLRGYRRILESVVPFRIAGGDGISGIDPVQGDVSVVAGRGGIAGVLAPVGDPRTVPLLLRLLGIVGR